MHEREIIECHSQTEMCVFFLRLRTSLQFLTVQCYLGTPVLYSICVSLLYMSATPVYISHTMTTRCNFLDFFMIYIIYMQCQICRETLGNVRMDADARLAGCPTGWQEKSLKIFMSVIYIFRESLVLWHKRK